MNAKRSSQSCGSCRVFLTLLFGVSLLSGCGKSTLPPPVLESHEVSWEALEAWDLSTVALLEALKTGPTGLPEEAILAWRNAGNAFWGAPLPDTLLRPLLVQEEWEHAHAEWTAASDVSFKDAAVLGTLAHAMHDSIEAMAEHAGLVHEH